MITIIITAYNVSKTLGRAIESCLAQTYKDLEILIVEDCSTDNTKEIIESYTDKRIRTIYNEVNLGAGMSRRIGSKSAKGEYTLFLDGDDYLDNDYIETLYTQAKRHDADVVSSGIRIIKDGKVDHIETYSLEILITNKWNSIPNTDTIHRFLNNKLVRRSIWDKVDYSSRRFVEDTQSCLFVLFYAPVVVCVAYSGYNYVQNPESLCHKADKAKHIIYQALCAKDICEFIKENYKLDFDLTMDALIYRIRNIQDLNLSEEQTNKYSTELAELFTYLLKYMKL